KSFTVPQFCHASPRPSSPFLGVELGEPAACRSAAAETAVARAAVEARDRVPSRYCTARGWYSFRASWRTVCTKRRWSSVRLTNTGASSSDHAGLAQLGELLLADPEFATEHGRVVGTQRMARLVGAFRLAKDPQGAAEDHQLAVFGMIDPAQQAAAVQQRIFDHLAP